MLWSSTGMWPWPLSTGCSSAIQAVQSLTFLTRLTHLTRSLCLTEWWCFVFCFPILSVFPTCFLFISIQSFPILLSLQPQKESKQQMVTSVHIKTNKIIFLVYVFIEVLLWWCNLVFSAMLMRREEKRREEKRREEKRREDLINLQRKIQITQQQKWKGNTWGITLWPPKVSPEL